MSRTLIIGGIILRKYTSMSSSYQNSYQNFNEIHNFFCNLFKSSLALITVHVAIPGCGLGWKKLDQTKGRDLFSPPWKWTKLKICPRSNTVTEAVSVGSMPLLLMVARTKQDFWFRDIEILEGKKRGQQQQRIHHHFSSKSFHLPWGYWLFCYHHESFWSLWNKHLAGEKCFGLA